MLLQLSGISTVNQGARLMAACVVSELRKRLDNVEFTAITPPSSLEFHASLGIKPMLPEDDAWRWRICRACMTRGMLDAIGLRCSSEVDAVIDAAGFRLSDQFGLQPAKSFVRSVTRWSNRGKRIYLLPQAFGPFEDPALRSCVVKIVDRSSLVFARDRTSLKFCEKAVGAGRVSTAPDITLCSPKVTDRNFRLRDDTALVIPNFKVVSKGVVPNAIEYVSLLESWVNELRRIGLNVSFLQHSGGDEELVEKLNDKFKGDIDVFRPQNPLVVKDLLGQARIVLSSRFHGLLGALSAGTPAIGLGWSHKYREMFEQFGMPELLVESAKDLRAVLEWVLADEVYTGVAQKLSGAADALRLQVTDMWDTISVDIRDHR